MYERFGKVCGKHISHFMLSALIVAVVCALTGCQNLMHKSVGMDNSVTAFKITLGDAQTYFIPQVILGNGRSVIVDMPDRIEKDAGVACSASTGATIVYAVPFKDNPDNPAVNITLQNGAVDDKVEFISKDNEGFQIKIYNGTTAGYVDRIFDYISAGYGRVIS